MEVTFKYKDKIITTPNLEKKLKRMKLNLEDIEILPSTIKKEENNSELEPYMLNKERVVVRSKLDDIRRILFLEKGTRPDLSKFFKNTENLYYEE